MENSSRIKFSIYLPNGFPQKTTAYEVPDTLSHCKGTQNSPVLRTVKISLRVIPFRFQLL